MIKAIAITENDKFNLCLQYNSREEVRLIIDMLTRVHSEKIVAVLWL